MRSLKRIDQVQVHAPSGDERRGWDESSVNKFKWTHHLGKHYEDVSELYNTMVPRPVPNLDDFILGTELSLTSPTVITKIRQQETQQ